MCDGFAPLRVDEVAEAIARAHGTPIEGSGREVEASDFDPAEDGMTARDFHLRSGRKGFQTVVDQ